MYVLLRVPMVALQQDKSEITEEHYYTPHGEAGTEYQVKIHTDVYLDVTFCCFKTCGTTSVV